MAHWVNLNSASGFVFKLIALWICNNNQYNTEKMGEQVSPLSAMLWSMYFTESWPGYKVIFVRRQRGCCRRIRIACKVDHHRLRHNLCSCKEKSGLPGFEPWPALGYQCSTAVNN